MKKSVAIWMFGGIGTGAFSQGQPVLENLIVELTKYFDITVYSRSLINEGYDPKGFRLRSGSKAIKNQILRWLVLYFYFLKDHWQKRYSLVCAFWGFPGGFLAMLMAKLFFLPSIISLQGGDSIGIAPMNYGVMRHSGYRWLALWAYQRASALITLTHFQKSRVMEYGVSRTFSVIPLGVDPAVFKVLPKDRNQNETHHFLHVSNFHLIKDLKTLLETFALICKKMDATLRIVGDEYDKGNGKQMCKQLGIDLKVDFYGNVEYKFMADHYHWADTMLHASVYEAQGIVIAEAAMSGILIAGTSVGLVSDLGEAGAVMAPPGDFQVLAQAVLETINDSAVANEKKKNAREWALKHDFFWTVAQYKNVFDGLV